MYVSTLLLFIQSSLRRKIRTQDPPAFIPQTPFCGREIRAEVLRKSKSPENSFAKPRPFLAPRRKKLPPSEFRQFLPSRRNPPLPRQHHTEKSKRKSWQIKIRMRGGERGRCDTAEAEGQPLRAVVERMLGRGGIH